MLQFLYCAVHINKQILFIKNKIFKTTSAQFNKIVQYAFFYKTNKIITMHAIDSRSIK